MSSFLKELLQSFNGNQGVTDSIIADCQKNLGITFPPEYIDFMRFANGGEGFVGKNSYAIFWKLEELQELNLAYQVSKFAPAIVLIGSDGGGEAYGFDLMSSPPPLIRVPFVGMNRELAIVVAANFNDFLDVLGKSE